MLNTRAATQAWRPRLIGVLALIGGVLLSPHEGLAAKTKAETFRVAASKERAYVAAFLAAQSTDDMVVHDASLQAGVIKAVHPKSSMNDNSIEITLAEAGPEATDVVVTYTEPGQLVGFFTKPVSSQVRRSIEERVAETTPRLREKYPDVPDRLILPRPGCRPPFLTHSEEVTTTGSLDELREAMAKAVDKLANEHKLSRTGGKQEDQFRLIGMDTDPGLFVFARGVTEVKPDPGKSPLSKRRVFYSYNEIATLRVLHGAQGATERRRVRITLDFDITPGDVRMQWELGGIPKKFCDELRDYFVGQQSQTVSLGQPQEEVEAILGKPKQVINLASKRILVYENLKITLVNGAVTDVQ